jgi:hypothetical protein
MARRIRFPSATAHNEHSVVTRGRPWKVLLLLLILLGIALPTYLVGTRAGNSVISAVTNAVFTLTSNAVTPTPGPQHTLSQTLPPFGSLSYTIQEGDSCDGILALQMHMVDAGQIFSDVQPKTVQALSNTVGHDCHNIHPGIVISLPPHYPLIAFGGIVRAISATTPQQVLPTPLINVPGERRDTPDCTDGCLLTVQVTTQTQVRLLVQTGLALHIGSWIWTRAALARKPVPGFSNYPYVDPQASLNGMTLNACDFQLDGTRDTAALTCDQITPNTIADDSGTWLFGVTGSSALDHWGYRLHLPPNTPVLLWLTFVNGNLQYLPGSPSYRYNDATHLYVKA